MKEKLGLLQKPDFMKDSMQLDTAKVVLKLESEFERQAQSQGAGELLESRSLEESFLSSLETDAEAERIRQKLTQMNFSIPKEKLTDAHQKLSSEKEKYAELLDSRIAQEAIRRNSLQGKKFYERLEFGALIQFSPSGIGKSELHSQAGYALSKKSVSGIGVSVGLDQETQLEGLKLFFVRDFARNFLWITEYSLKISNNGIEPVIPSPTQVPLKTGLGTDLRIVGKMHLRSVLLLPLGKELFSEGSYLKKHTGIQLGLIYKNIK